MSVLKTDLANAVYHLSGNRVHTSTIDFVFDMHEGRPYHNLEHVTYCVNEMYHFFEESGLSDAQKCHLIIALYFHDICQDFTKPVVAVRNSVELMEEVLCDVLSGNDISAIENLILSTGAKAPISKTEFMMHDADYAILGNKSWNEYHSYVKDIEKEALVQGIDKTHFNKGRIGFLMGLTKMSSTIFLTSYFGKVYEWQARKNILRELAIRKSGGEF